MSAPAAAALAALDAPPQFADSTVIAGTVRLGNGSGLAQGAVIRSADGSVDIGTGSHVIENSVVIGSAANPVRIGRRTVFGHRCLVIGATVGDLCEIGNASILMPGARLDDRVFLGEGTLVPAGMSLPSDVVAVGRPAHIIRTASEADFERLRGLRDGDLSLPAHSVVTITSKAGVIAMGQLYDYRGISPTIAAAAMLFPTAEVTGDVVIGERSIIGAGVKIIGDSHGPVRIGNDVQILENTVLHLLPDNELVLEDGVIVGPGAMIHGCHIGAGSVVEPGAIVCDGTVLGAGCVVRAGAVVKQRSRFPTGTELDGMPAVQVGQLLETPAVPGWAMQWDDLPTLIGDSHDDKAPTSPHAHRSHGRSGRADQRDDQSQRK